MLCVLGMSVSPTTLVGRAGGLRLARPVAKLTLSLSPPPLPPTPFWPLGLDRFVLLMTPSRYDLIQFALGNWWHTDTPRCRGWGLHAGGGAGGGWEGVGRGGVTASHCKDSSLTNKPLLLIINGNEGPLSVSVCV